jgi:protein ImuB
MRVGTQAEHRPERASRDLKLGSECDFRPPARHASSRSRTSHSDPDYSPRPAWLLAEPAPLAEALEHEPWILRDGPERIESGWWDGADVRRDYFIAESPRGELCWIYRDHRYGVDDGEWFLHGLFA